MNIFICDDNEADIAQIRSYTKIYFAMEPYDPLVKGFTSGDDLLNDPLTQSKRTYNNRDISS